MGVAIPKSLVEPATSAAKWRLTIGTILVLVVAFAVEAIAFGNPTFPVDDAYITLHNAAVLRHGDDAHYVGIPALVGATSGAHVAVTALLSLAMPATWALWSACRLGIILYALGLLRIAFAQAATWPTALVAMVAGMTAGYGLTQLLNGLETSLAMAAVAWTLALASEPRPFERATLLILIGVLPFVRPELAALSGLVFLLLAYEAFGSVEHSDRKRLAVRMLSLTALGAVPFAALYWLTTGLPFPNTVQAKKFFFAEGCGSTLYKLDITADQLYRFGQTIGVLSRAVFLLLLTRVGIVGFVFMLSVITAYFLNLPGALGHYEQRYIYVFVPLFIYAACSVVRHRLPLLRFVGPALLVVAIDQSAWHLPDRWEYHLATKAFTRNELKGVADWSEVPICSLMPPPEG